MEAKNKDFPLNQILLERTSRGEHLLDAECDIIYAFIVTNTIKNTLTHTHM